MKTGGQMDIVIVYKCFSGSSLTINVISYTRKSIPLTGAAFAELLTIFIRMKVAIKKERVRLYIYIGLAWIGIWLLNNLIVFPETFFERSVNVLWRDSYLLVLNFIFFEYAWPYIVKKRERVIYSVLLGIFLIWVFCMLLSFGNYAWRALGIKLHIYTSLRVDKNFMEGVNAHVPFAFMSVFFVGVIRHAYDFSQLKKVTQKLRVEKQEAELNYLKSQTNPHFLFNTLNNIYSLSRDKSDQAPEAIMKLSKILRFMLYEAGGDFISIEQELKIIDDYISLEKLRYDESLRVELKHDVENMRQAIPPLLLIPLVENAFKHGVSETRYQPFVDIYLSCKNRQLEFVVKNSVDESKAHEPIRENIGLSNLSRQLELLYKEYSLNVKQEAAEFIASLKINLASHV
jgi:two-component system, LytTR family, sensor kinase